LKYSVNIPSEGTHTLIYWSVDNAGNTEVQHNATIRIDKTAPVTINNAPKSWMNTDVTVNLNATDSISGVSATYYTLNGGIQQTGTSVSIAAEGTHTLIYWSVDNAGNLESKTTSTIQIDKTAPVTTAAEDRINSQNEWYNSNPTLTLTAVDKHSGITQTLYRINSGPWVIYTLPVVISTEGANNIEYRSVDLAGNSEDEKLLIIKLDRTAPTLKVVLDQNLLWPANHKLITVNATINTTDVGSQIDSVVLTSITSNESDNGLGDGDTSNDIQNAQFGSLDTSFTLRAERSGNGTGRVYTITYTVTDKAGNTTSALATVIVPHNQSGK